MSKKKKRNIRKGKKRGYLIPFFEFDKRGPITVLIFDCFSFREIIFLGRVCRTFYDITGHRAVLNRFLPSAVTALEQTDPAYEREELPDDIVTKYLWERNRRPFKLSMNGEDWDIIAEEQGAAIQERRLFSLNSTKNRRVLSPTNEELNASRKLASGNEANSRCTPKFPLGFKLQFGNGYQGSFDLFYSSPGNDEEGLFSGEEALPIVGKERSINRNIRALLPITQETKDESMVTVQPASVPELRVFDSGS